MWSSSAGQDALPGHDTPPMISLHRLVCRAYEAQALKKRSVKIHRSQPACRQHQRPRCSLRIIGMLWTGRSCRRRQCWLWRKRKRATGPASAPKLRQNRFKYRATAGSLGLSCVRGASLEETVDEDSPLATSMPATPATQVQPEDDQNALDMKVLQRTPVLAMGKRKRAAGPASAPKLRQNRFKYRATTGR